MLQGQYGYKEVYIKLNQTSLSLYPEPGGFSYIEGRGFSPYFLGWKSRIYIYKQFLNIVSMYLKSTIIKPFFRSGWLY